ncbi:unnamed protein product [Thlaspi arvense]|uniref:F-box associated domain-containing protein n=1 Tax=Thlaspi arvense TaxID=13288 RepID=A0AAU9SF96_THLAR|nr:unnamed protein product [Thlaspi arvense]
MKRGRRKNRRQEQDLRLKECHSIVSLRGSNQIEIMDAKGEKPLASRRRSGRSDVCEVPLDVVIEVLLRLPPKSMLKFNGTACVYNSTTGQHLTLPAVQPDIDASKSKTRKDTRYYIGYDPVNDQYKLVCTIAISSGFYVDVKSEHWVLLLEAGGGSWRKVVPVESSYHPHVPSKQVWSTSNGSVLHYTAWIDEYTCAVVSFDVRSEELTTIPVPEEDEEEATWKKKGLVEYGGEIAVFDHTSLEDEGLVDLWVLEDAGEKKWSEKKRLVLQPCQRGLVTVDEGSELVVKGTTQDGKVIFAPLKMHSSQLYILFYDLQRNDLRKVEIKGVPPLWSDKDCYFGLRLMMDENTLLISSAPMLSMEEKYTLRYTGGMVPDVNQGIYRLTEHTILLQILMYKKGFLLLDSLTLLQSMNMMRWLYLVERRVAKEKEKQEMVRRGLLEPPKAKGEKMSNLMKVLASEASSKKEIRTAAAEREQAYTDRNAARKLTREKKERKLFDDPTTQVYKIKKLSHPKTRFKVEMNARQNTLTECSVVVMTDGMSVVVVENHTF